VEDIEIEVRIRLEIVLEDSGDLLWILSSFYGFAFELRDDELNLRLKI
jgi:hypothetical protein